MAHEINDTRPAAELKGNHEPAKSGWLIVSGLLLLTALPVIGGALRFGDVAAAAGSRPLISSVAAVTHIVTMSAFCLLGAFQFSPALRTRSRWHRSVGQLMIPTGLIAAVSAMWLAVFFTGPTDEFSLAMIRLVLATAMFLFLVLGGSAIKRRDFIAHSAWMTRAYAVAVANGTQALVVILWTMPFGDVGVSGETVLVAVGSLVNVVAAEALVWRRSTRRMQKVSDADSPVS